MRREAPAEVTAPDSAPAAGQVFAGGSETARLLRAILELLPVGVAFVDASGKAVIVNEQVKAIWGEQVHIAQTRDEFGRYAAWWPATGKPVAAGEWGLARALTTGEVSRLEEIDIEAQDGRRKTILSSNAPLRDEAGNIVGGMSVLVDVTERRALERRTHEALDALLELAATLVSDSDASGKIAERLVAGPAARADKTVSRFATLCARVLACQHIAVIAAEPETGLLRTVVVTGSSPEQQGQFSAGLGAMRLADRFGAAAVSQLHAGETVLIDVDHLHSEDPARMLSRRLFLVAPIVAQGTLYGYIGVRFGDEAEHYSAENRARALAIAQLVGLVVERAQLTRERAQAEAREAALVEATRRMDEFLGLASHELRTPLTSITANVQLAGRQLHALQQQLTPDTATPSGASGADSDATASLLARVARAEVLLERTERQIGRLDRLVGDLLDVSRIQAGKLELRAEACDLLAIVREAVREQRAVWPRRGLTMSLPRRATLTIAADADRIGQVVTNYLTNALKYSPADQPVAVRVRPRAGVVRVEVRDRGPGLSVPQRRHLFERFYRVPGIEQQSGSGMGLGLGLHICKTIIEHHGGDVGVESVAGKGCTFWFTLPLPRESATAAALASAETERAEVQLAVQAVEC